MAGVGDGDGAVGGDANGEACREGFAAAEESLVECVEQREWIGFELDDGADGSNEQCDEHAGLEAFASDIASHDDDAAVFGVGDDLEKITADFQGGTVFAFDFRPG